YRAVLMLPFLLLPALTSATTYHVATTGSDSAPCTTEAPCRTIRHATSRMSGGDTVIVHAGTYEEHGIFMPNGSSSAPSTLKANPGDTVLLRWGGARQAQMIGFRTGANWQVVDGFVMDGVSHQTDGSTGISFLLHAVDNGSNDFHNITVQNNDIKN